MWSRPLVKSAGDEPEAPTIVISARGRDECRESRETFNDGRPVFGGWDHLSGELSRVVRTVCARTSAFRKQNRQREEAEC